MLPGGEQANRREQWQLPQPRRRLIPNVRNRPIAVTPRREPDDATDDSELVGLFDDLAGLGENRDGDREAERLSRLQVDDEVEGRRLLDRKITRVFALENAIHVNRGATKILRDVRTIRHETARLRIFALGIDRGQRHGRDALDDRGALIPEQCASQDDERGDAASLSMAAGISTLLRACAVWRSMPRVPAACSVAEICDSALHKIPAELTEGRRSLRSVNRFAGWTDRSVTP
jgi:hypothetical protein